MVDLMHEPRRFAHNRPLNVPGGQAFVQMSVLLRTSVARRVAGLDVGGCVAGTLEHVLRVLEVLAQVRWYPMQNEFVLGEARGQPPRALDSAVVLGVTAGLCQSVVGQIAVKM